MTKRVIIALILILTYSVGFAHGLIPHCSDDHSTEFHAGTHDHAHHSHTSEDHDVEDHAHVEHGDHYDEDFFDYLECLLEGVQHHDHSCDVEYYLQGKQLENSSDKDGHSEAIATVFDAPFHIGKAAKHKISNVLLIRSQKGIDNFSGRAPPPPYL